MWSSLLATASQEWDGDEVLLLLICAGLTFSGVGRGMAAFKATSRLRGGRGRMWPLLVATALAIAVLGWVTWQWTAREIRHGQSYALLTMFMGTAWLTLCTLGFHWLGLSIRDDVCERGNLAASVALSGAMLGATCVYAGAMAHTLRQWQDVGLEIELCRIDDPTPPIPLQVQRPSWFRWIGQRVIAAFGLRRSASGGFGDWVPDSSAG